MRSVLAVVALAWLGGHARADGDGMRCTASGCRPIDAHHAGDRAIGAGIGVGTTWLRLPEDTQSRFMTQVHMSFGVYATPTLAIALRGHVDLGHGPTTVTSLGVDARWDSGGIFFAGAPAIAHVQGPMSSDALAACFELRAGLDLGSTNVSLGATPMFAFANDGFEPGSQLRWALRLGIDVEGEL